MENLGKMVNHRVVLEGRSRLEITGVEEVERFDESEIIMSTTQGRLTVRGDSLHVETLSLDGGALKVDGQIESLSYEEQSEKGGLWNRLFR